MEGKIRKRGCSSSSSSSVVRRYRLKRAILVGKKGGSSTPCRTRSPTMENQNNGDSSNKPPSVPRTRRDSSLSARKLGATLWEINGPSASPSPPDLDPPTLPRLPKSGSLPPHLSDPSYSPISERMMDGSRDSHRRRMYYMESPSNASFIEAENQSRRQQNHGGCMVGVKTRLKDVSGGLTTSKELLKALYRILAPEDHHSSSLSLVSAIRTELDRARSNVDHLTRELRSNRNDIDYLMKHFAEEKEALKRRERERARNAIASIAEELEVEKKTRRQTERLNKRLGEELADTKTTLSKALKELDSEKRAKDILEQVCDELAAGIGDDRAEVELLKQESEKVREEVEKEREMLQLADVLREERVQMKLSEAKYQFEEKNSAVERLRSQLEAYLGTKASRDKEDHYHWSPKSERSKELHAFLRQTHFGEVVDSGNGEEDSAESDMHSIELNVENSNRIVYDWSYACGGDDSKRSSVDRDFRGRKSISEKIQWGNICLNLKSGDGTDKERLSETVSQEQVKDCEEEIKRYKSLKSLRDHILSGSKMGTMPLLQDANGCANSESKQMGSRGEPRILTSPRQ